MVVHHLDKTALHRRRSDDPNGVLLDHIAVVLVQIVVADNQLVSRAGLRRARVGIYRV